MTEIQRIFGLNIFPTTYLTFVASQIKFLFLQFDVFLPKDELNGLIGVG